MTAIAPAPTPQPHTGDVPPGAHPPTSADILRAAGDMGIGTSAATSFAASLQGLAGQARSKGQELAASLEQHAASIQTMLHKAHGMRAEHWKSSAGRAYRNALDQHEKSLAETHQQVQHAAEDARRAGEEVAAALESQAHTLLGAAAGLDGMLKGLLNTTADALDNLNPADIIKSSGALNAQHALDQLLNYSQVPTGLLQSSGIH